MKYVPLGSFDKQLPAWSLYEVCTPLGSCVWHLLWIVTPSVAGLYAPITGTSTHIPFGPLTPGAIHGLRLVIQGSTLPHVAPLIQIEIIRILKRILAKLLNKQDGVKYSIKIRVKLLNKHVKVAVKYSKRFTVTSYQIHVVNDNWIF